jgi:hypothetical protein
MINPGSYKRCLKKKIFSLNFYVKVKRLPVHGRIVMFELLSRVVRAYENNLKTKLFLSSILLKELIQHGRKLTTRWIPVRRKEKTEHAARKLGFQVDFLIQIIDHIFIQKLNETFFF